MLVHLNRFHVVRPSHCVRIAVLAIVVLSTLVPPAQAQPVQPGTGDDLFLFRPDTPERQVRGALLAEKLDRPELAQSYLSDLLDANLTAPQLMELRQTFGIGVFLQLSSVKALHPTSRTLLQKINDASRQSVPATGELDSLVQQLGQSDQQTVDASLKLLAANSAAVSPLLAADPATPAGTIAAKLLQKYALRFRDGLLQALPDAAPSSQVRILNLLAGLAAPNLVPDLLSYQFSDSAEVAQAAQTAVRRLAGNSGVPDTRADAADVLIQKAKDLIALAGRTFPTAADVRADRQLSGAPADQPLVYGAASLAKAVAWANSAARILPDDPRVAATALVAELTEQSWPTTWPDQMTLPDTSTALAQADSTERLALATALETDNAAAIISVLRRTDTSRAVLKAEPGLLRRGLLHSDPRVRLLTAGIATTIGESNRFTQLNIRAAASGMESPEAVVIDSRSSDGLTVSAVLKELNYATQAARTGQGGFEAATSQLHCELILIHSNVLRWSLSDTIANLRTDYRTQDVPIIVYGPEGDLSRTQTTRNQNAGVWFEIEPISPLTLGGSLKLQGVPPPMLSKTERKQMLEFARKLDRGSDDRGNQSR